MKMTMVESRGGIPTGPVVDEDFDDILNFFDFPLETLEEDGLGVEWNASESKFLGPIPTDVLMDFPPVPHGNIGNGRVNAAPTFNRPNKLAEAQGTGIFQTQSPVSVLESNNSCPGGKSISIKHDIAIPVRPRSKRPRSSAVNPWILMEPISSTRLASRKISDARKGKEKKRKVLSGAKEAMKNSVQQINDTMPVADVTKKLSFVQQSSFVKRCTHCEITKTPQWREGPLGPKTLCNACGVRYRSGRLFPEYRPAASPTFVPSLHSNSHRKVIEMRKKAVDGSAAVEEPYKMIMGRKREALPGPTNVEDTPMSPAPEKISAARKVPMLSGAKEAMKGAVQLINDKISQIADVTEKKLASAQQSGCVKKCTHCEVTKTPQWREGPLGPRLSGEEKRKVSMLSGAKEAMKISVRQINDTMPKITDFTEKKLACAQQSGSVKKCTRCGVTKTPQWREGPLGPKTLSGKEETTKVSMLSGAKEAMKNAVQQINDKMPQIADITKKKLTSARQSSFVKRCTHCEVTKTTQWREGPMGPKTLSGKEKKWNVSMLSGAKEAVKNSAQQINDTMPQIVDVAKKKLTSVPESSFVQKCRHCEATKTPQWRGGPWGPKTLCNACGVRYRSGRLFPEYRPTASPTFVPSLHSNSHRKVIEMIKEAVDGSAAVEERHRVIIGRKREAFAEPTIVEGTPMSPAPEFVPMSSYLFDVY